MPVHVSVRMCVWLRVKNWWLPSGISFCRCRCVSTCVPVLSCISQRLSLYHTLTHTHVHSLQRPTCARVSTIPRECVRSIPLSVCVCSMYRQNAPASYICIALVIFWCHRYIFQACVPRHPISVSIRIFFEPQVLFSVHCSWHQRFFCCCSVPACSITFTHVF